VWSGVAVLKGVSVLIGGCSLNPSSSLLAAEAEEGEGEEGEGEEGEREGVTRGRRWRLVLPWIALLMWLWLL
jgi:hypothetical protein